jgi:hypothetical protein
MIVSNSQQNFNDYSNLSKNFPQIILRLSKNKIKTKMFRFKKMRYFYVEQQNCLRIRAQLRTRTKRMFSID